MATQLIDRDRLGDLTKIGQGGQGIVYRAPKAKIAFADAVVYKEYKSATASRVDFTVLAAMPALLGEELTHADGKHLVSIAAWPCALVQDDGATTGFVMPAIPGGRGTCT